MAQVNVMIVEDERIIAEAIAILLKKLNYNPISIVSSGEEAISKLKDLKLDLILMDIILTGALDGIETAKIINNDYNIPIIFITAYGDKETLNRAKLSEPYGYIIKPVTCEDELLPTIELALYNHKVKNELQKSHKKFEEIKRLIQPEKNFLAADFNKGLEVGEYLEGTNALINDEKIDLVEFLKSFSNSDRFLILEMLKFQPFKLDELQMMIAKSQSATSHHIRILEKAGLIKGWKNGKYIYYSLNIPKMINYDQLWVNWLKNLTS